jgi:diguanylate cyclase (GGDEF)-like protein
MMACAALLVVAWPPLNLPLSAPPLAFWAIAPLFAVTEVYAIHLPTVRNAHTHTLREIPVVAGLAFLNPFYYAAAFLLGTGTGLLLRGQRGLKLVYNLSVFSLEASLGIVVYHAVLGGAVEVEIRGWLAAFAAIVVTDIVSAAAITAAISIADGRFDGEVLKDAITYGLLAAIVNTCTALLAVVLTLNEPMALPLLAVTLPVLVVIYRGYVGLARGYSQLELLYRFVGSTSRTIEIEDATASLLREACELLGADSAQLVGLPTASRPGTRATIDASGAVRSSKYDGPDPRRDAWWAPAALGESVLRARDSAKNGDAHETQERLRDGLAVPLHSEGVTVAVLLVMNRSFERQTFTTEDLRLFETLAGHASVELDKAHLVARLRRVAQEREYEAHHDALTGLANRRAFHEAFRASGVESGAILLVDLDDFKDINDTLGHDAGDVLLCETGTRLFAATNGLVARLGGDEFAVLLPDVGPDGADEGARAILDALAVPVMLRDVTLAVNASIGIALFPEHGSGTNELLQHADVAMYVAKETRNRVELYSPGDAVASHRRLLLAADLGSAIEARTLEVWYQPQADPGTKEICGFEGLLRWTHPTFGPIAPEEIVRLAERTGAIRRLTNLVIELALDQRAAWAKSGHDVQMSVNITPGDLCDIALPDIVVDLLAATETPPFKLTLEVTESGVMSDPLRCLAVLERLSAAGVRISIDDFGTGHSSLAYLERLPVDEVKIDRSFITRIEREATDAKVVRATVALAHDLGLTVVAEGVESALGWSRAHELGCELIQGYAVARPMPSSDAIRWLDARSRRRVESLA